MYHVELKQSGAIANLFRGDNLPDAHIEIDDEFAAELMAHPIGFGLWDYVDGSFVFNTEREAALQAVKKKSELAEIIQSHLDSEAQSKGYDSIFTAVTYADEPANLTFQTEGQALRAWRSNVWASCYAMLAEWEAGNITEPTIDEVLAQLPQVTY